MIARNWAEGRASLWSPTLDCLAHGQRSLHLVDFPVSAYLSGWLWKTFGGSLDIWGRATAVTFMAAAVGVLFLLVGRRHGEPAALGASLVLALSPVAIIYGQSFMLEASLVFFTIFTFYCLDIWSASHRWAWIVLGAVSFALLLLTKIYMLVLILPLAAEVIRVVRPGPEGNVRAGANTRALYLIAVLAAVAAIVPAALWYWDAYLRSAPGNPSADHVFYSVRQSASVHRPPHPLLWSPDFYRQMLDDLAGLVLTPVGLAVTLAGFLHRDWRRYGMWILATVILVALLPKKFYEMNYYWMVVLPPLCIAAGLGWHVVSERIRPSRSAAAVLLGIVLVFSLRYAARPAWVTPDEDRHVVAAGLAVQAITDRDEPVVTMHGTTIDLLYYCDRPGWAVAPDEPELLAILEKHRRQGARYLVVAGPVAVTRLETLLGVTPDLRREGFRIYALESVKQQAEQSG
jgi:4-amino-4-deoxy-L-arabinose transferase-like glycosyltransferase